MMFAKESGRYIIKYMTAILFLLFPNRGKIVKIITVKGNDKEK